MEKSLKINYINFIGSSNHDEQMYKEILKSYIKDNNGKDEEDLLKELIEIVNQEINFHKKHSQEEIREILINENKDEKGFIDRGVEEYILNKKINCEEIIDKYENHLLEYSIKLNRVPKKNNTNESNKNGFSENLNDNILQWYGNKSELIELTKALIENGNLKGKQEDIFNIIQKTFNVELNNIDQAITKFNSRNQENETKFLDSLKSSLSKYIKTKLEKNR